MKRAIAKGYIHGPRIHTAGKGLATTGGLADYSNNVRHEFMGNPGPVEGVVNGPLSARQAVRQRFKDGADLIKINLTGGSVNPRQVGFGPQWRPDELEAVVETAADYNMTVAAHAVSAATWSVTNSNNRCEAESRRGLSLPLSHRGLAASESTLATYSGTRRVRRVARVRHRACGFGCLPS